MYMIAETKALVANVLVSSRARTIIGTSSCGIGGICVPRLSFGGLSKVDAFRRKGGGLLAISQLGSVLRSTGGFSRG